MFELFKKHPIKTFNNSSKNEQLSSNETLLLSQFRGDIWKLAYNNMLSEEGLIKELISAIGVFFDAERCVLSRIKNDKIYADIEWKHNKVKAAASNFSVPLDLIEKLDVDIQRTITLEDMMEAISGPKMGFLKPFIDLMAAAIGDAPSLSTPVKVNGRIFGFITMRFFDSKVEMYTQNVKDVITDAANIIALAIERRRSEEMFRASFDLNPDAMIFVNVSDGLIFDVNEGFVRTSGYLREEVTGRTTRSLNLWHSEKEREEVVAALKKYKIVKNREMKFIKKDGSVITCLYSSILINLGGEPKVFTIIKDISDRKETEIKLLVSEEKFRVAFNTSPDAMNLNRASDGKYVEINEGFTKLTGYSRDEVMRIENFEKSIWASENHRIKLLKKLKENGFVENFEANFVVKDGTIRTGLMSAKIILLNGEKYMLAATRDITERKAMEEKIISTSEKLKKAVDYLERTNAELERFTYVASHDMQEPLRMVSNYAQLLAKKYKGRLDSDADDYIGYMVSGATRMSLLIKDLLVFSRIGKNRQEMAEVNLNELLKDVVAAIQLKVKNTNAAINIGELPVLKCDKSQIFQVFQNLLSNALKFVKQGQSPEIAITAELKGNEWIFCVKDNGIGISSVYFNKIFVPFERLHSKDEYEGTGVGLSICKKITEYYGGRIWVESEPDKGSSFYFSIPQEPQLCKIPD